MRNSIDSIIVLRCYVAVLGKDTLLTARLGIAGCLSRIYLKCHVITVLADFCRVLLCFETAGKEIKVNETLGIRNLELCDVGQNPSMPLISRWRLASSLAGIAGAGPLQKESKPIRSTGYVAVGGSQAALEDSVTLPATGVAAVFGMSPRLIRGDGNKTGHINAHGSDQRGLDPFGKKAEA